jgi:DNA-binding NarL/FixJ family response regulator
MAPARLTVVEDDPAMSQVIGEVLRDEGFDVTLVSRTREVLALAEADALGDVLLFDLELHGQAEFATIARVREVRPRVPIVALTGHSGDNWVFPALEAGCTGYVLKMEAVDSLANVVRQVMDGGSPLSALVGRRVLARLFPEASAAPSSEGQPPALSERELAVLRELADGYTYEQISLRLDVSLSSVRTYVQRAYAKLGVRSKSEATATLMRLRWLR